MTQQNSQEDSNDRPELSISQKLDLLTGLIKKHFAERQGADIIPLHGEPFRCSGDYRTMTVDYPGLEASHIFTALQAAVVKILVDLWRRRIPAASSDWILEAAGSDGQRLPSVFKTWDKVDGKQKPHPALCKLIVSKGQGLWGLAFPLPKPPATAGAKAS